MTPMPNNQKEKIREHFQANMLDGDDVKDCGDAVLSAEAVLEYIQDYFTLSTHQPQEDEEFVNELNHILWQDIVDFTTPVARPMSKELQKHLENFIRTKKQEWEATAVEKAIASFCIRVKNELRQQRLDGYSLDGTNFDAVFDYAKKSIVNNSK